MHQGVFGTNGDGKMMRQPSITGLLENGSVCVFCDIGGRAEQKEAVVHQG